MARSKKKIEDMYKVKRFSQQRSFGMKAAGIGAIGGGVLGSKI